MDPEETYVELPPLPDLAHRVRTVWVQRTGPEPYVQRNLPTGGMELQCLLGTMPRLIGPLTRGCVELLSAHSEVVGARFWPGGASPLLGLPARELVDAVVPLDELWGSAAVRLSELLANARGPSAALGLLQRFLVTLLASTDPPDPLVTEAVHQLMPWRPVAVAGLCSHLSVSTSQLRRRFLDTVGVGPKVLQRTLRFQGYLALAQAAGTPGGLSRGRLVDLAAQAGYADQAHMSRECTRLGGVAPSELLGGTTDRCGCGHDHRASYQPFLAGGRREVRPG